MKIIITYAYAGVGHKKAAMAVEAALKALNIAGLEIRNIDILDYTNAFFKFSYPRIYLFLINRMPAAWAFLYYFFDFKPVDFFVARLRRFLDGLNAKKFIRFIKDENPDIVISTHFLPSELVSNLKKKGEFKGKLINIVTDFLPHSFWMARSSDYFIAGIEKTKKDLLRRGVSEEKIKVMGIPCDPVFSISKNKDELKRKLGIEQGFFNVLIMSGGFGTGPIRGIVNELCNLEVSIRAKIQIIVICGKNEDLFKELDALRKDSKAKIKVFGYMNNVDEFMEISDIIITKPGGLTISEALSKNLPMIIVQPIPGQEARNCKILTGYGVAVRLNKIKQINNFIEGFVNNPDKINNMKTRIKLLAYSDAAKRIAEFVIQAL